SETPDTLQFRLPSHADAVLSRMNTLREEQHFCDITLLLLEPSGAAAHSFCFHGHKVVLAAASDFLRDQFLLHSGQAELTVSAVTNVEVGKGYYCPAIPDSLR
uniref:BTB domain-containing protein n=1 Tax=Neogobius melanostomus TaxID=47308 RepID=A0A8C6UI85_9GOBI